MTKLALDFTLELQAQSDPTQHKQEQGATVPRSYALGRNELNAAGRLLAELHQEVSRSGTLH
jgi:hypothetical protein